MKIVDLTTFRALPSGTIFAKYEPCCFEELCAKGETLAHDFVSLSLTAPLAVQNSHEWGAKPQSATNEGASIALDFDNYERDACFEDGQLFAVYEKADIEKLMAELARCYETAYKQPTIEVE